MNSSTFWAMVVLGVVVISGGYLLWRANTEVAPGGGPLSTSTIFGTSTDGESRRTVTVRLDPQNDSDESGLATLVDMGNSKTKVTLEMENAPSGVKQPAHIHAGTCRNIGEIVHSLFPLENGSSETTIDASLDAILEGLPMAINVHKSADEQTVYYSCGDIKAATSRIDTDAHFITKDIFYIPPRMY